MPTRSGRSRYASRSSTNETPTHGRASSSDCPICTPLWRPPDDMLDADTLHARLTEWLASRLGTPSVDVTDLTPPSGTGYSSETLLFTAAFDIDGERRTRR